MLTIRVTVPASHIYDTFNWSNKSRPPRWCAIGRGMEDEPRKRRRGALSPTPTDPRMGDVQRREELKTK